MNDNNQKDHKEYIAFEGEKFTIEWYFNNRGKSISLDYLESLDEEEQAKLFELFKLIGEVGVIKNKTKFRNEGDKIYAFKPQPHRFLCFFFKEQKIIITNGFHKKTDKLPKNEKDKALKIKSDYELRIKRGDYYE
ncbi:MAG: type II toxin-antitoxin system RelE/ParE family toxin [Gammaproteobacteria bacterium]|nr:MAG: type II toxin-antitoxin system RelE/ParE family toxin [Gammaproteobacteria bacterium]